MSLLHRDTGTMRLDFSVIYTLDLKVDDIKVIKSLTPASACGWIMDTYNLPLHIANCIRKEINGGDTMHQVNLTADSYKKD